MARIPYFLQMLEQAKATHIKKNEDYAGPVSPFENFDRAAYLISWFNNHKDATYVNHIATKLARLATLLNKEFESLENELNYSPPNNESIDDSFNDLFIYVGLWASDHYYRHHPITNSTDVGTFRKTDTFAYPTTNPAVIEQPNLNYQRRYGDAVKTACAYCHMAIFDITSQEIMDLGDKLIAHKECFNKAMGKDV